MIYLVDQKSLYPHCFMGANLFSKCQPNEEGWNGSLIFPKEMTNEEDGIKNSYKREQGKIESIIQTIYNTRASIPKKDPRNLAYKIFLNGLYGITGSPKFTSIYDLSVASDCTALARRCIKYARYRFRSEGYECIYTDSDSIFVKDTFNNESKILELIEKISEEQRQDFNIYIQTHGLALECKIKKMWFFRDDLGNFIKKHYCYLKEDNSIVFKGIQAIKGTASPLSKLILKEVIEPIILNGEQLVRDYDYWKHIYQEYAKTHPELLVKRFRVWPLETYKIADGKEEATAIHAQIAKVFGAGEWFMVANTRIGPGKGTHYTTLERLKEKYGDDWIEVVKLNNYISDIREFVYWKDRKKIKE